MNPIVGGLMRVMEASDSPMVIRATSRALELTTGLKSRHLVEVKDGQFGFSLLNLGEVSDWYARNGFYGIAGLGGSRSYTGKVVNPITSIESSAVYACAKIIAEDTGSLDFFPYERTQDGQDVRIAYENDLYELLHDMPNPEMSAGEFREALTGQCALGMDGFARIMRGTGGKVVAMWPLVSQQMEVKRNQYNLLFYRYTDPNTGKTEDIRQEDIFHLRGFTFDGARGDNIIQRARQIIGLALATQEYAARFFSNDSTPGIVMERPAGLQSLGAEDIQKIKDAWVKWHSGVRKAHEPAILQDGIKVTRIDPDHQKLQLVESRKYQVVEVARIYRMPLHKLADLDRATFTNIEQQGIDYTTFTLGPWLRRWEEAVFRCLLTPQQRYWSNGRPRLVARFDATKLQRGDFATQTAGWHAMLQDGVITIDEVRAMMGLNPLPDGKGKVPYQNGNMREVGAAATEALADPALAA